MITLTWTWKCDRCGNPHAQTYEAYWPLTRDYVTMPSLPPGWIAVDVQPSNLATVYCDKHEVDVYDLERIAHG